MIPPGDDRIRVVAVTTDLSITGAKRVLVDGALGLDRRRFDSRVLLLSPTPPEDPLRRELEVGGIPVHHVHVRSRLHLPGLRALARWLETEARPHVLHTHSARAAAVVRLVVARRPASTRPRVIVHFHGTVSSRALRPKHRLLDRILAPATDLVLAPSTHAAARGALAHGFRGVPTQVLPNGVDLERLRVPPRPAEATKAGWGVPADARVVLLLGRWGPAKGQDVLLDAIPEILAHPEPVRVVFVAPDGGGGYRARLERRIARTALRRTVVLAGRATDTSSCYAAADVVVMPSRDEPFGLVAVEAMGAGRPLVVARAGGLPEVCGDEGVLWVAPGDPHGIARAVLLALSERPAAHAARVESLRRRAARFTLPGYLASLEAIYARVLAARVAAG
jgi:glycosyltransferase involved in cell wall biosynthesis